MFVVPNVCDDTNRFLLALCVALIKEGSSEAEGDQHFSDFRPLRDCDYFIFCRTKFSILKANTRLYWARRTTRFRNSSSSSWRKRWCVYHLLFQECVPYVYFFTHSTTPRVAQTFLSITWPSKRPSVSKALHLKTGDGCYSTVVVIVRFF